MGGRIFEWLMDHVMPWIFIVVVLLVAFFLFVLLPLVVWHDATSPTFALKKAEFECAQLHTEQRTTWVLAGKAMVPTTSTETVCDVYTRRVK